MKEEVERIKKLVGIDHNRWEQPCTCDKCKNMCEVPCIGTPKDIEAIIDAGYADRLKETMWMVGYLAVKEKPIAMIQPTVKDGWCAFRQPDGLCELHDQGNPLSKMVLIGVSSVDRLLDCYVYYGLWASESKIEEMIADYKGRIYEYYEFKEEVDSCWDYYMETDELIEEIMKEHNLKE